MNNREIIIIIILLLGGIFLNIPFINMALHTDEGGYLLIGKRILFHPLDPFHGTEKYEGEIVELRKSSTFAPLIPYYFAFILWVAGKDSEIILRLFFILFSPIALLSAYYISRKFLKHPFYATLLIAFSPAFFLLSHITTTDISGLALSLMGLALFISYAEKDGMRAGILAGITLGIAILIRYQNLYMLPLIFFYSLCYRKDLKRCFMVVFVVFLVLLPWFAHNLYFYGNLHILSAGKAWKGVDVTYSPLDFLDTFREKIISSLAIFGSSFLFLPCILFFYIMKMRLQTLRSRVIELVFIFSLLIILIRLNDYAGFTKIQLILYVMAGLFFLLLATELLPLFRKDFTGKSSLTEEKRESLDDFMFILGWFFFLELLMIIFLPFNSVRYTLPQVVPALIFFVKIIEENFSRPFIRKFVLSCIVLTFVNGSAVGYGGYILANTYRDFAETRLSRLNREGEKEIYFIGEEGFRYYMERVGARYLLRSDNSPDVGSFVIIPTFLHQYPINPDLMKRLRLKETVVYDSKFPIRIVNPRAKTSFFCYYAGLLPYSFSKEPLEEFKIYEVVK